MLRRLYWIDTALLAAHEVDSAYWKEWRVFHLPFGLGGFVLLHVALFLLALWGFELVIAQRRAGLWAAVLLAAAGIFAPVAHGALLLQGGTEFRAPVSLALLAATGAVSLALLAAAVPALRRR
jgi:Kef-type K+ transport system membrane component KefB